MPTWGDQVKEYGGVPVGQGLLGNMGFRGKHVWVHGGEGTDRGSGENPRRPLATLTYAYSKLVDGRGDVVHILNDGSTGASVRDVALVWAKDNCHIIGHCAPGVNKRARIAPPTASAVDVDAYTPYLTLSASGCIISNVSWTQGQSEDTKPSVGIKVSGSRNCLDDVDILTGAHANQGDEASNIALQVTGSENKFKNCWIGTDTVARSAANCNLKFGSGANDEATRNLFYKCIFPMFADAVTPVFVSAAAAFDVQRFNFMEDCAFINTGTSSLTAGITWAATTGYLYLKDCGFGGVTNITAADNAYVLQANAYFYSATPVDQGKFLSIDIA